MSGACKQNYISLLTRSIAILHNKLKPLYLHYQNTYVTKLGGLVTYYENLLPIVLWQNNYIALRNHMVNKNHHISTTAMLPATKFREVLIYNRELFSINSHVPSNMWSCEVTWNARLYLYYCKSYGHYTWQDGNLLWEACTYKFTQPFKHVVMWGYVLSTNPLYMVTTIGIVVAYNEEFPAINPLITWSSKAKRQFKHIVYLLHMVIMADDH